MKIYTSTYVRYTSLQYIIRSIVACMRRCIKNGTWWSRGRRNKFSQCQNIIRQINPSLGTAGHMLKGLHKMMIFSAFEKGLWCIDFWLVFLPLDDPIFDLLNLFEYYQYHFQTCIYPIDLHFDMQCQLQPFRGIVQTLHAAMPLGRCPLPWWGGGQAMVVGGRSATQGVFAPA